MSDDTSDDIFGKNSKQIRLSSKITGIVFWGAVLTALLVVSIFIKQSESLIESRKYDQSRVFLSAVEKILNDELKIKELSARKEQLQHIIDVFKFNKDFVGLEIKVGPEKILIGTSPKNATSQTIESDRTLSSFGSNKLLLRTYFSTSSDLYENRKNLILFLGVISFAFGLIINYILKKLLTNPIDKIIETAVLFAKGDKSIRFDESENDEFAFMSRFINRALDSSKSMNDQLKESVHEQRKAKEHAEDALKELEQAQDRLVQSEKLASLGKLTAGVAHEIKNPLNFINNFAETSVELFTELKETLEPHIAGMEQGVRDEINDMIDDLSSDLSTIDRHGKRADSIVKNMLMHSRSDRGEPTSTDINALVKEALGLAYHGERANDKNFQIEMDNHLEENIDDIKVIPQDVTRVLINLFSNAFYATEKRKNNTEDADYTPVVTTSTVSVADGIEIRIRDNGTGIPKANLKDLFAPFFTTKPTGEGTGLGLSISYDIITKNNNGRIEAHSKEGEFTEFVIWLPDSKNDATEGKI